jgi:hypothetical protein
MEDYMKPTKTIDHVTIVVDSASETEEGLMNCANVIIEYTDGSTKELKKLEHTGLCFHSVDEIIEHILKECKDIPRNTNFKFEYLTK